MLKAGVIEILLYGWVCDVDLKRETLRQAPNGIPPSPPASHWLPAPATYQPHHGSPSRTGRPSRKRTRCEAIETTIRKRRLFFAGSVTRLNKERLPPRVMVGTMTGRVGPRPGGQSKTWRECLVDDLKSVSSHRGVHGTLPVGVWS